MSNLGTDGTYDGRKQSVWYPPRDIGVSYCPFCGSRKVEKWNSMFKFGIICRCLSCGNAFSVEKEEYMSIAKVKE